MILVLLGKLEMFINEYFIYTLQIINILEIKNKFARFSLVECFDRIRILIKLKI